MSNATLFTYVIKKQLQMQPKVQDRMLDEIVGYLEARITEPFSMKYSETSSSNILSLFHILVFETQKNWKK